MPFSAKCVVWIDSIGSFLSGVGSTGQFLGKCVEQVSSNTVLLFTRQESGIFRNNHKLKTVFDRRLKNTVYWFNLGLKIISVLYKLGKLLKIHQLNLFKGIINKILTIYYTNEALLFMKSMCSNFWAFKLSLSKNPAFENNSSHGTEVVKAHNFCLANFARFG